MGLTAVDAAFWSRKRVLITGHTGFKGSWLTLWLQQLGAVVTGFALNPETSSHASNYSFFQSLGVEKSLGSNHIIGDIRDCHAVREAVKASDPEIVLHLAAQPLVSLGYSDPLYTWNVNVNGTLHLLEALKSLSHPCSVVLVTTDKVYQNRNWEWGYRENDRLGGHDPYSSSKAAMELLVSSWRSSFCGDLDHQTPYLYLATARAGNVIGGGDWAANRIIPDLVRALVSDQSVQVRSPNATRPWQHVLEPLAGYLMLAQQLSLSKDNQNYAYNFGPKSEANRSVRQLVDQFLINWPHHHGWMDCSDPNAPHEADLLNLVSDRAIKCLGWSQRWDFLSTVRRTANWYLRVHQGEDPLTCCLDDLQAYHTDFDGN